MSNIDYLRKKQLQHLKSLGVTDELKELPNNKWGHVQEDPNRIKVFASIDFLVQIFKVNDFVVRVTVNKTMLAGDSWQDNIKWEELQEIKAKIGYGDHDAVEIFPKDCDVVNVSNMRHLFVFLNSPYQVDFIWRKS